MVNIGKSIKKSLADVEEDQVWLAKQLGCKRGYASRLANSEHASLTQIEKLSNLFKMKVSEFIALGE